MSRARVARKSRARRGRREAGRKTTRPGVAALDRLQRTAGNTAVLSLLAVQRDDDYASPPAPVPMPGSLVPRYVPPAPIAGRVRERIVAWLDSRKTGISMQVQAGTVSMPELVAQIREQVAGAAAAEVVQIESLIRQRLGRFTPPRTRGRQTPPGQASELAARLKNLLGKEVEVGTDAANLVISVSGAVGRVRVGDVEASAEAGTGGVGGKVRIGRGTVTASPDAFGLKASIPMGSGSGTFAAKLSKSGATWSKWSASFSLPIVGRSTIAPRPAADAIGDSVRKAEQAIRDIAGHLHRGGIPTDGYVRERIGKVTPAIGKVGSAIETQEGPNVSASIGAGGGPKEVGGQTVQEAHVGVSLVIAF